MENTTLGFIGAGRITRIFLLAFKNLKVSFKQIAVTDTNRDVMERLKIDFPEIKVSPDDLKAVAGNDIVFVALHPPVIMETLEEIGQFLDRKTILVSLAPKVTIEKFGQKLNGHDKIARLIPNAPSAINQGYNPVCFSNGLSGGDRQRLTEIFEKLGKCVVADEEKLESYAIVTAMSPTYFWFQFLELYNIGRRIGLSHEECREGISNTIRASITTLFDSGLPEEEVLDLIPVKPISDHEEEIIRIFQSKLLPLFDKIKP